jgi:hypothetical protein
MLGVLESVRSLLPRRHVGCHHNTGEHTATSTRPAGSPVRIFDAERGFPHPLCRTRCPHRS